jgi:peroxiredoxin
MPEQANNQPANGQKGKPGFFTPARNVLTWAFAGVMIVVWLTSCNSGDQTNQTSVPTATPPTPATNTRIVTSPNTGAPTLVTLSQDIRDTKVKTLDGGSLKLSDFNNKVLVVNLWATWCGPCRQEMPDLVKLNKEYKARGLVVLGVATTYNEHDDQAHVKDFIKSQNIDYKILWDDGTLAAPLVQSVNGRSVIPQSFVISRDGKIMKHFSGFNAMSTPALMRQAVEEALADKGKA